MNTKDTLLEKLGIQLELEQMMHKKYKDVLSELSDATLTGMFSRIVRDEENHERMLTELILLIEGYDKPINPERRASPRKWNVLTLLNTVNAVLFLSPLHSYMRNLLEIIEGYNGGRNIIYVSYSKLPKHVKALLTERGVNLANYHFIDCVEMPAPEDTVVPPHSLEDLSIAITQKVIETENPLVVIDTISSFSIYHNDNLISSFVANMNDKARTMGYRILWVGVDEPSFQDLNAQLTQLADETIKA